MNNEQLLLQPPKNTISGLLYNHDDLELDDESKYSILDIEVKRIKSEYRIYEDYNLFIWRCCENDYERTKFLYERIP